MLDLKPETKQQNTRFDVPPRRPSNAKVGFVSAPIILVVIALFLASQTMMTASPAEVALITSVPGVTITVENEDTGQFKVDLDPQLIAEIEAYVPQPSLSIEAQIPVNPQLEGLSAKPNPPSDPSLTVRIAPIVQIPSPETPVIDVIHQETLQNVSVSCLIDMGVGVDLDRMIATFPGGAAKILNPTHYGMPQNSTMFQFADGAIGGCIPRGFSFSPNGLIEKDTGKVWAYPQGEVWLDNRRHLA
jgi:hypothetical protein